MSLRNSPCLALWLEAANAKPEPSRPRAEIELAAGPGKAGTIRQARPGERFTLASGDAAVEVGVEGLFSVSRRAGAIGLMKSARAVLPFQFTVKKGRAKLDVDAAAMPVCLAWRATISGPVPWNGVGVLRQRSSLASAWRPPAMEWCGCRLMNSARRTG